MSKAYDRVEWRFLIRAMRAMGFSSTFQDLIYRSICNIKYRICVNGFFSKEFQSTRGVRQGDPLSPLLFIIAQQILAFNLAKHQQEGVIKPYKMGRNITPISHLFYADDMLLFTNGRLRSLRGVKQLMQNMRSRRGSKLTSRRVPTTQGNRLPGDV